MGWQIASRLGFDERFGDDALVKKKTEVRRAESWVHTIRVGQSRDLLARPAIARIFRVSSDYTRKIPM